MVELLVTIGITSLLAVIIGVLLALKIHSRSLRHISIEHEAWQHSQEAHQHLWEIKQGKQALEFEQKLTRQVQLIQDEWQRRDAQEEVRFAKLTLEHRLAYLPRVEDIPVPSDRGGRGEQTSIYELYGHPPSFYQANLSGRDLSHRYLRYADLREAQLADVNFYMADLSGACLTGANLSAANLAGANLTGADLRGSILTGANMLVTDLHKAILNGANLLGAHNLTIEQLNSAIYDGDTEIDIGYDITPPRLPGVCLAGPKPTTLPASVDSSFSATPIIYSVASSELSPEASEP
jgi:pentapeptide repeat protein